MHHKTKEKLVKLKESGLTADELREQMRIDNVPSEEAESLIAELYSGAGVPPGTEQPGSQGSDGEESEEIVKFDYENLIDDNFKAYRAHVATLPLHQMTDYHVYKVEQVIKELYPGLPDTPKYLAGIRITNNKPLHATRVAPHVANELNAQLPNTGRYYLLKQ